MKRRNYRRHTPRSFRPNCGRPELALKNAPAVATAYTSRVGAIPWGRTLVSGSLARVAPVVRQS